MGESKYNDFRDLEVWATNVNWNSFFPFILRYLTIQLINQSIKLSLTWNSVIRIKQRNFDPLKIFLNFCLLIVSGQHAGVPWT
jgi:hypothetical protein